MLIPAGFGLAKYRFLLSGDQEEMIVTMGHDAQVFTGSALANALQDAFIDTWTAARFGTSYTFVGVDVQVGSTLSGVGPYFNHTSSNAPVVGTSTATRIPQNTAILVRKATATPGRRGRGRMFMPAIVTEGDINDAGILTAAKISDTQTAVNAWLARLDADLLNAYIFHDAAPATPSRVISMSVDSQVATQRRRLRR